MLCMMAASAGSAHGEEEARRARATRRIQVEMCRPGECGWARAIMRAPPPSPPGRGVRGAAVSSQRRRGKRSGWHLRRARMEGTCRGHAAQRGATARRAWGEQSYACGEAKRTDMHRGGGSWSGRSVANQRPVHRIGVAAHHPIISVSSDQRRGQLVVWNHSANVPGTPSRHSMPRRTGPRCRPPAAGCCAA